MKKKILYIIILIVFIALVGVLIIWASNSKNSEKEKNAHTTVTDTNVLTGIEDIKVEENEIVEEEKLEKEEQIKSDVDIVIGEDYFITQINDIYLNFENYKGKTVEIEGFPLNNGYTFVARYGPGCCAGDGIGLLEYEYDKKLDLEDEKDWIKVIGTLKEGNDDGMEYIYIDATSVEKMDTRGKDTVKN